MFLLEETKLNLKDLTFFRCHNHSFITAGFFLLGNLLGIKWENNFSLFYKKEETKVHELKFNQEIHFTNFANDVCKLYYIMFVSLKMK